MRSSGARTSCSSTVVIGRPTGIGPSSSGGSELVIRRTLVSCARAGDCRGISLDGATRPPGGRESIAGMPPYLRLTTGGRVHVRGQLSRGESPQHRDRTVVARDTVETQYPGEQPEPASGDPTPPQIAHHDVAASHAVEFAEDRGDLVIGEV